MPGLSVIVQLQWEQDGLADARSYVRLNRSIDGRWHRRPSPENAHTLTLPPVAIEDLNPACLMESLQ